MSEASKLPLRRVPNVRALLINEQAKKHLQAVAANHMKPERMTRLMVAAIQKNPKLAECEPITMLGAMMTCASIGLEPNTVLGHAYLIPFENKRKGITEVNLIIGYKGMIDLARRSGHVVNIHADVVFEGDDFSFEYGSNQHLTHRPAGSRENPTHAYCHAKLTDGEAFVVLPYEVVLKTRDSSQGYKTAVRSGKKDTPWIAHEHAMAKKTAVRALFNELPISLERISDALEVDDGNNAFAQFAMAPDAGVMPSTDDGKTIDGEIVNEVPEPTEEQQKPKADPAKETAESETDDQPSTAEVPNEDEIITGLFNMVKGEIDGCQSEDEIDAVFGLYEDQIKPHSDTKAYADLEAHANKRLSEMQS